MSYFRLLYVALLLGPLRLSAQEDARPERALCVVCALKIYYFDIFLFINLYKTIDLQNISEIE